MVLECDQVDLAGANPVLQLGRTTAGVTKSAKQAIGDFSNSSDPAVACVYHVNSRAAQQKLKGFSSSRPFFALDRVGKVGQRQDTLREHIHRRAQIKRMHRP